MFDITNTNTTLVPCKDCHYTKPHYVFWREVKGTMLEQIECPKCHNHTSVLVTSEVGNSILESQWNRLNSKESTKIINLERCSCGGQAHFNWYLNKTSDPKDQEVKVFCAKCGKETKKFSVEHIHELATMWNYLNADDPEPVINVTHSEIDGDALKVTVEVTTPEEIKESFSAAISTPTRESITKDITLTEQLQILEQEAYRRSLEELNQVADSEANLTLQFPTEEQVKAKNISDALKQKERVTTELSNLNLMLSSVTSALESINNYISQNTQKR